MARAALDLGIREFAALAKVGVSTVAQFEGGRRSPIAANLATMRRAFEGAGVRFTEDGCVCPPAQP
jgi:transcriptional regulator with XRE-family HTH domain